MWVKFHDQTPNDPEIDALSDGAFRLYISAIFYAQAELTDGLVSDRKVRRLTPNFDQSHLDELTAKSANPAGPIFGKTKNGYTIRNFAKYNKTREYWEAKRVADAARMAKWRAEREAEEARS